MSITASQGHVAVTGATVTINNGTKTRAVELTFSADGKVVTNAEMRFTWSLDGSTPADFTFGPGDLAENQQFDGTRTVVDVHRLWGQAVIPSRRISA